MTNDRLQMIERVKLQTAKWLDSFIIAYNICPFAHKVVAEKTLYYAIDNSIDIESCLEQLMIECERLDSDAKIETTLVIYPDNFNNFDDFLDYLELANVLLIAQGYEGVYQLASFHPKYYFAEVDVEDVTNYTNRSPFPMLHLIRESSIEQALKSHPDASSIPTNNIKLTRSLGLEKLQELLAATKILP